MKRVHAENWSLRERLVLASSVLRSGDQNWMSVSRAMRTMSDELPVRSAEWYSQKQCAVQYEQLLNTVAAGSAPPKRKKRAADAMQPVAADTPQEIIVRKLTQERIEELRSQLVELKAAYLREKREQEELLSGRLDSRLDEIEQADAERESESNRTKEQATPVKIEPTTPQTESKPTSPLLTSLLQMPSPSLMHRSPTISSLLISSPSVPSPAPATPPRPIAATTLSQLLESPTIAVPATQKTQSPSRSPAPAAASAAAREQVLALENVKDDLIDVKIEDIPMEETDPSAVVTDVDPTEVIVAAENIQTEEVVGKENTSIISNQTVDSTSAIDDTPDSDLIAETLSELADLDSRTVEMIVVGPNAQLAGGIKEELVEITSTDIEAATGAAATMKEIIEDAEVVVEGPNDTGAVIEETVVDSTVIVDNIVDFGSSIVEETVVQEEVVMEKVEEEEFVEEVVEEKGEEEVKVEEEVVGGERGGGGEGEVVEDEVLIDTGETVVKEEEVVNEVVEQEGKEEEEEKEVEEVVKEPEEEEVVEERNEKEQVVSIEETVVETVEPAVDPTEETVEKEIETKNSTDEEESQDTQDEETKPVEETKEVKESEEGEKQEDILEAEEEAAEEAKEVEEEPKVVVKEEQEEEEAGEKKEEEEEEEEEEETRAAITVAVNEVMSSSSTPSTPTSAVLPNIMSIASDTVSTSRPETPSTEEDNEPVANLAKKINRRHGGLSGSSSLPNSPLSVNAQEERAALNAWKKSIMLVYNRLATHKYASLFLKPITNEQARGYHSVIHRPMDLSTIKKNIELGNLRTTVEFQRDMMLMFQNAIMYNNQTTLVYEMATQMQAECIQHIQLMVEAMGEGVPLRSDRDEGEMSKMTRGGRSGKAAAAEAALPAVGDATARFKRKRTSMPPETTAKKKKVQGDEEGKKN